MASPSRKRSNVEVVANDDDDDDDEVTDDEEENDVADLSPIVPLEFDGTRHRRLFGVYTEKGGVGKTNFIHTAIRSGIFRGRILIIDSDPQNNVVNGFMSPSVIARSQAGPNHNFVRFDEFLSRCARGQDPLPADIRDRLLSVRAASGTEVSIVLGSAPSQETLNMLDSEREFRGHEYAQRVIRSLRALLDQFEAVILDFNPKMSLLNRILLMACDDVLELVTGDIHSQAAMASLLQVRNDEGAYFGLHDHPNRPGPQRFHITIVPSLIDRSRGSLRTQHRTFIDKVVGFVAERRLRGDEDLHFRGFIGRSHALYGRRPVLLMRAHREPGNRNDAIEMVRDVTRILHHCLRGTEEPIGIPDHRFPWEVAITMEAAADLASMVARNQRLPPARRRFAANAILYFARDQSNRNVFKVGTTRNVQRRFRSLQTLFRRSFELVCCFASTAAIVKSLEEKVLSYFSNDDDAGELINFQNPARASMRILFDLLLERMRDQAHVENMILEA